MDRRELKRGLTEAAPYLLSHHEPGEHYRCYAPVVFGRRVHLCARCLGVYPGLLAGVVTFLLGPTSLTSLAVVLLLPLPALVDWTLTSLTDRRGYNAIRTVTGAGLGYAYGIGLGRLFVVGDLRVFAVGAAYGLSAGLLLWYRERGRVTG